MIHIYIIDLCAFNSGVHHGGWINLGLESLETVQNKIDEILDAGHNYNIENGICSCKKHEEWEIGTFECEEHGIHITSQEDIETLMELETELQRLSNVNDEVRMAQIVASFQEYRGNRVKDILEWADNVDVWKGTIEDFVETCLKDGYIPLKHVKHNTFHPDIASYIDAKQIIKDLRTDGRREISFLFNHAYLDYNYIMR